MNTLLLIMFILIEIGFIAITFSENREKKVWYRNRLLTCGLEIAAFIIFSFFPGIDFSYRFLALIVVLVIRFVCALIGFLRKRKADGNISRAKVISSAIISVVLLVIASVPSYLFGNYKGIEPTGEYQVAEAAAILVDPSREEAFENDGSSREVPVNFFYPENAADQKYPLVIFSHGAFGYNRSNYSLYQELASHGYVVVSLSHPYHSFFCKDTGGKTITVNPEFFNEVFYVNEDTTEEYEIFELSGKWLKLRTEDISFVLDTFEKYDADGVFDDKWFLSGEENEMADVLAMIDFDKIGVIGHSLGGAAAENIGRIREDVDAVVDLDGTMIGEQVELIENDELEFEGITYHQKYRFTEEPYPVSILNIDNQEHHDSRVEAREIGMPYANNSVMDNAVDGYDTYFVNSGHMNLTDLPLFSPFLASMLGTGSIDAKDCIVTMDQLVLQFFDAKLKDQGTFTVEESYGK